MNHLMGVPGLDSKHLQAVKVGKSTMLATVRILETRISMKVAKNTWSTLPLGIFESGKPRNTEILERRKEARQQIIDIDLIEYVPTCAHFRASLIHEKNARECPFY